MHYLLFAIFIFILASCDSINVDDSEEVSIATFNIAWLGDGKNDLINRSDSDYKILADIIEKANIDIWALQEIENSDALGKIVTHLDGYSFFVGNAGGNQNLALLYKNNIEISRIDENLSIAVEKGSTRPGLTAFIRKGNFDAMLMNVHFKSTSRYDDTEEKRLRSIQLRTQQAIAVTLWADSIRNSGFDDDIIVLGDFNDYPLRDKNNSLLSIINNPNYHFLTSNIKSCKFSSMYSIDNILVSSSASDRYMPNTVKILNIRDGFNDTELKNISDHCPVTAKFNIKASDND